MQYLLKNKSLEDFCVPFDENVRFSLSKGAYPQIDSTNTYVLLRLRVQNRRKKWNFPLNFRTMRKLSDLYSGIFQNHWSFNYLDVHLVWTTSETLQN